MSPSEISFIALLCIFGSSILGMAVSARLPEHLLSDESQTIIKAARSVVVGLAALTLGLLIATAKGSFDAKETELKEAAAKMIALDHLLAKHGPASEKARGSLRQIAVNGIAVIDRFSRHGIDTRVKGGSESDELLDDIMNLPEQNASQTWIKNASLSLANDIAVSRWKVYQRTSSTVSPLFLVILIFWLMTIFFSLGLIAPCNVSVLSALFTAALSMTGAILLTLELDQPYGGLIQISTEPLKMALRQLNR
jgi:hypothetical protein